MRTVRHCSELSSEVLFMIKLQDFARQQGVTDRAIQKHIKKYAVELDGHVERKGPNGTWIDDEGCSILRSKMKSKEIVVADGKSVKRIQELEATVIQKEQYIAILEAANTKKTAQIAQLENDKLCIEEQTADKIKQAEDILKNKLQTEFNEQLQSLKEDYQRQLDAEKRRKLTFRERLFGSKV